MADIQYIIPFIAVILLASLVRSTFGFGDALLAMPLLVLFISIRTATPVVAFMGLLISIIILIQDWRNIILRNTWGLILGSILGIPLGLLFLKGANENIVKLTLALILISFSLLKLFNPKLLSLKNENLSIFFGFIAGILGGAYNSNGPPIIIYGTLRNWQPERFRAILQGIFFPTNLLIVIGHGAAGLWTKNVMNYTLVALPIILLSIFIGHRFNRIIPSERFAKYVYMLLLILGLVLIVNTFIR